jgi:hypothetical protein
MTEPSQANKMLIVVALKCDQVRGKVNLDMSSFPLSSLFNVFFDSKQIFSNQIQYRSASIDYLLS